MINNSRRRESVSNPYRTNRTFLRYTQTPEQLGNVFGTPRTGRLIADVRRALHHLHAVLQDGILCIPRLEVLKPYASARLDLTVLRQHHGEVFVGSNDCVCSCTVLNLFHPYLVATILGWDEIEE